MQEHKTNCPRCFSPLTGTFENPTPMYCKCGYIPPVADVDAKLERNNLRAVVGISVLLVLVFTQLSAWGNHALEIRWLQAADKTGLASVAQLERMAVICAELKKRDCVEYAYARQAAIDKKNAVRLAEYLISRHKYPEAIKLLKTYVAANKQDMQAYMVYAGALTETGKYDEAAKYYEYLISKSQGLPAEAAQNYVKCLARAKRYEAAEKVIYKIRRAYPGTQKFMDGELRVLAGLKSAGPGPTVR